MTSIFFRPGQRVVRNDNDREVFITSVMPMNRHDGTSSACYVTIDIIDRHTTILAHNDVRAVEKVKR